MHLLGEYWENIVIVGGWVPELLLGSKESPHIGSIDVDLALNHLKVREEGYKSIQELLVENKGVASSFLTDDTVRNSQKKN